MATVRKRNGKWQAQVRRTGYPSRARNATTKPEAQRWIRDVEAELDAAETQPVTGARAGAKLLTSTTVVDLLTRYRARVTPRKRGHIPEINRPNAFLGQPRASLPLSARHRPRLEAIAERIEPAAAANATHFAHEPLLGLRRLSGKATRMKLLRGLGWPWICDLYHSA